MLKLYKVVYFEEIDDAGNKTGRVDFRAVVEKDGEEIVHVETEGYCDALSNKTVVESYEVSEEELDEFFKKGDRAIEEAIEEGENIIIEVIDRKLGRCYGNCVWQGIEFERVQENLWKMTTYRGSNTWGEWQDIGMTGQKTDYIFYCDEKTIYEYVEPFLEDLECFELNLTDSDEWTELLSKAAEFANYSAYDIFDFPIEENESEGDIIVYVWDEEGAAAHMIFKDRELTDEDKKKLIEYFENKYFSDEEIDNIKKMIESSKTLSEFFEKYESVVP